MIVFNVRVHLGATELSLIKQDLEDQLTRHPDWCYLPPYVTATAYPEGYGRKWKLMEGEDDEQSE